MEAKIQVLPFLIVANGCDASETLAPLSIGGNQEPWEFKAKIGRRLALIGGLDQFNVLTAGPAEVIRKKVFELFEKVGYEGGFRPLKVRCQTI